jgi:hypothetical protein
VGACRGELLGAARPCDHSRAHGAADLDRGEADATGRAEDEQGLPTLQAPLPAQRDIGREIRDRKRGGIGKRHGVRHRPHVGCLGERLLGHAAMMQQGHDALAGADMGDPVTAGGHRAGGLQARRERQGRTRLVVTRHHDGIGIVGGGGDDVDHDLPGSRRRRRQLAHVQHVQFAPFTA